MEFTCVQVEMERLNLLNFFLVVVTLQWLGCPIGPMPIWVWIRATYTIFWRDENLFANCFGVRQGRLLTHTHIKTSSKPLLGSNGWLQPWRKHPAESDKSTSSLGVDASTVVGPTISTSGQGVHQTLLAHLKNRHRGHVPSKIMYQWGCLMILYKYP